MPISAGNLHTGDDEKIGFFSDFVGALQMVVVGDGYGVESTFFGVVYEVFWSYQRIF